MGVEQLDGCAELSQVDQVDGSVLVHPVVDEGLALSLRGNHGEERQVVDVEAGERHGVDLVGHRNEMAGEHGDVDQSGEVVVGGIFRGELIPQPHLLENGQLNLEEFDGAALDGELGVGDDGSRHETHRLDRVLGGPVLHVGVDVTDTMHPEGGRTDAFDLHTELGEEDAQVLHHVVGAGVAQHGEAGRLGSSQQGVLSDGVAALGEDDVTFPVAALVAVLTDLAVVESLGGHNLQSEGSQHLQVGFDGTSPEVATPGVGQLELLVDALQGAQEHDDASGASCRVDVHLVQAQLVRTCQGEVDAVVGPLGLHADGAQHLEDAIDLLDVGDAVQHGTSAVDEAGTQQGDSGILRRPHLDRTGELVTPLDEVVHRAGARRRQQWRFQSLGNPVDVVQGEILIAGLDAMDGALGGVEQFCQLVLGETTLLAGITDEASNGCRADVVHGRFLSTDRGDSQ